MCEIDHKSLKELLQQVIHSPDQQVYMRKLLGFDFIIEYKVGKSNLAADALSRLDEATEDVSVDELMAFISYPMAEFYKKVQEESIEFEDLQPKCEVGTAPISYSLRDGEI